MVLPVYVLGLGMGRSGVRIKSHKDGKTGCRCYSTLKVLSSKSGHSLDARRRTNWGNLIRVNTVMKGYLKNPSASKRHLNMVGFTAVIWL